MKKLLLAIVFAVLMTTASFANCIGDISAIAEAKTIKDYNRGVIVDNMDTVVFGSYPQSDITGNTKEPIEWIVIRKSDDSALLMSKYILDCRPYYNTGDSGGWIKSSLRNWLNNDFYNKAFNSNEKNKIKNTQTAKSDYGGNIAIDKVFLLSNAEMGVIDRSDYFIKFFNQQPREQRSSTRFSLYLNAATSATNYAKNTNNGNLYVASEAEYGDLFGSPAIGNSPYWQLTGGHINVVGDHTEWYTYKGKSKFEVNDRTDNTVGVRPVIWVDLNNSSNNISTNNSNYPAPPPGASPTKTTKADITLEEWEALKANGGKSIKDLINNNTTATSTALSNISNLKCVTEYPDDITVDQMDTVTFGNYYKNNGNTKEPIEWIVLEKQGDKALLLSKNIVDTVKYSDDDVNFDYSWNNSNFKTWLNNDFFNNAFSDSEKSQIINNNVFNDFNGDKIFILNAECLDKYFNIYSYKWSDAFTGEEVRSNYDSIFAHMSDFEKKNNKLGVKPTTYAKNNCGHSWGGDEFYFYANNTILPVSNGSIGTQSYDYFFIKIPIRPAMWVTIPKTTTTTTNEVQSQKNIENIFGSNVNIDGTSVIQHPDGSITIGGEAGEGDIVLQEGNTTETNNASYNNDSIWDKIHADKAAEEKLKNTVYYYAKQESKDNKIYKSIKKKNIRDGWFGTGFLAETDKIYYSIEIDLNDETEKRLTKYADFCMNEDNTFLTFFEWMLLAGNSMNKLENVSMFGISPGTGQITPTNSHYLMGRITIFCDTASQQEKIYNKISKSEILILATNNVVKSHEVLYDEETYLGNITKFQSQKPIEGLNWVTAYVDCENEIIDYSKNHIGNSIFVKDGYSGYYIHEQEITEPLKKCPSLNIFLMGQNSHTFAKFSNTMIFLEGKGNEQVDKYKVFGGKIRWVFDLDLSSGFEDFERYYNAKK